MKKICTLACMCLLMAASIQGQKLEFGLHAGISSYEGDLNARDFVIPTAVHPTFGAHVNYNLNQTWAAHLNFFMGSISGDDRNFESRLGFDPLLDFNSSFQELTLNIVWSPMNKRKLELYYEDGSSLDEGDMEDGLTIFDKNGSELRFEEGHFIGVDEEQRTWIYNKYGDYVVYDQDGLLTDDKYNKRWTPYLFLGVGLSIFNPEVNGLPQDAVELQPGTYSNLNLTVPSGAGLRWDFSQKFAASLEGGYRYPFSDYIDGTSDSRDPEDNDWYLTIDVKFTYKLGGKDYKMIF